MTRIRFLVFSRLQKKKDPTITQPRSGAFAFDVGLVGT